MSKRLAAVAVFALSLVASAQSAAMPPPPPPPPPPSSAPVAGADDQAVPAPPGEELRVRGGVSSGLGTFIPGPMLSWGLEGRVGVQFNRMFGAYLALDLLAGAWISLSVSQTGASAGASAVGLRQLSLLGDLTVGDVFFVSAGVALANGGWASVTNTASSSGQAQISTTAAAGWIPGIHAKLGGCFNRGRRDPTTGRRAGVTVSLDLSMLFGQQVAVNSGTGGVGVAVGTPIIGLAPTVMVGYEWK